MLGRVALVLLFVVALPQPEGQILQVAPLARDGDVLVSFKLAQEPTDEIRSAIHSGLTVSLVYKIDLRRSSAGGSIGRSPRRSSPRRSATTI